MDEGMILILAIVLIVVGAILQGFGFAITFGDLRRFERALRDYAAQGRNVHAEDALGFGDVARAHVKRGGSIEERLAYVEADIERVYSYVDERAGAVLQRAIERADGSRRRRRRRAGSETSGSKPCC